MVKIDEEKSVAILMNLLSKSGLNFHKKLPDEEGGIFVGNHKLTNQEAFDLILGGIASPTKQGRK